MSKLDEARIIINEVDKEMIELFKKRMKAATMVAEYKKENNLPIFDEKREKELIDRNVNILNDKEIENYYKEFITTVIKVSKDYQATIINEDK